jgi:hypothetical protein
VVDHQQVAKPLVGQLVGHQHLWEGLVQGGPLVHEAAIGEQGAGGVLHAAEGEVGDAHLGVFGEGVAVAKAIAKEGNHLRRFAHGALGVALRPLST